MSTINYIHETEMYGIWVGTNEGGDQQYFVHNKEHDVTEHKTSVLPEAIQLMNFFTSSVKGELGLTQDQPELRPGSVIELKKNH